MADKMTTTTDDSGITVDEAKDGTQTVSFTVPADADLDGIKAAIRPWTTGGTHLVGNFADLQRMGAVLVAEDKAPAGALAEAVVPPANVTDEDLKAHKEAQKAS